MSSDDEEQIIPCPCATEPCEPHEPYEHERHGGMDFMRRGTPGTFTTDGLPAELAGWTMDEIRDQIRRYSPELLLARRDATPEGLLWRKLLEAEILERCELGQEPHR